MSHPDVEDCAVVGVESSLGEEEIKAFIVMKPNKSLTAKAIQDHCRPLMAKHMVPASVEIANKIPRTPTGKPEKGKLSQKKQRQK